MTSIPKALALGALALTAGLVGTQPVWAALGRQVVAPAAPATSDSSLVSLLSLGDTSDTTIQPTALGTALGRPPISQAIPGPTINN